MAAAISGNRAFLVWLFVGSCLCAAGRRVVADEDGLFKLSETEGANVTFAVVAFPKEGETIKLRCRAGAAIHEIDMSRVTPYPLFTATVNTSDDAFGAAGTLQEYQYALLHANGSVSSEDGLAQPSDEAHPGRWRSYSPMEKEQPTEFFGDFVTFNDLPKYQLPIVHPYTDQKLKSHTIYDESMIGTVHLEVDPVALKEFLKASQKEKGYFSNRTKPRIAAAYTYINAKTKYHADLVALTLSGFGSLTASKVSYTVHFGSEDRATWGLKKHKIKSMTFDPSLVHEYASVDVWRSMGVPVHQIAWTRLYINGENMGLYNNIETITNSYLHQRFHSTKDLPDGTLYKCDDKAYFTLDTVELCGLEQGNASGWNDLRELVHVFTDSSDKDFPTALEKVFDVQAFIKAAAVEMAILRRDGYFDDGSNYVIWRNPASGKWTYISWDFEVNMFAPLDVIMFDKSWSFFKKPFIHTTVFPPYISAIPLTRVLLVPEWRAQYTQFVRETADLMSSSTMDARLDALHKLLRPHVEKDPLYHLDMGYGLEDFDRAFDSEVHVKMDFAVKHVIGWAPGIPDWFHPNILHVDLLGVRPFMKERAAIVREELSPTCPRNGGACNLPVLRKACEVRGHATCVSGQCVCKPGLCFSGTSCEYFKPKGSLE